MATKRIENRSDGPRVVHWGDVIITVPPAVKDDSGKTRNGTAMVDADVLKDALAKDAFTRGLFAEGGDLVDAGVVDSVGRTVVAEDKKPPAEPKK